MLSKGGVDNLARRGADVALCGLSEKGGAAGIIREGGGAVYGTRASCVGEGRKDDVGSGDVAGRAERRVTGASRGKVTDCYPDVSILSENCKCIKYR